MKKIGLLISFVSILMSSKLNAQDNWKPEKIQAGFYTPQRVGQLWDTWLYFYKLIYCLFLTINTGLTKRHLQLYLCIILFF
jgi:hypothetical protein